MAKYIDPRQNTCRNCNSTDTSFQYRARAYAIHKCTNCQYYQIAKPPASNQIKAIYSKEYFEKGKYVDDYAAKKEQARRLKLIKRAGIKNGSKILDFGMASGDFCRSAQDDYKMHGVDISEDAINKAKEELPDIADYLFCSDIHGLPFEDNYFDGIVLWDVIEHLQFPQLAISKLKTKLKPGGILLFSTPDIGALSAKLMKDRWHFMTPPEHLGFFSIKSAKILIERHGFEVKITERRGKWVNFIFLLHKFARVFPEIISTASISKIKASFLKYICIYVPTNDILYMACKLPKRD